MKSIIFITIKGRQIKKMQQIMENIVSNRNIRNSFFCFFVYFFSSIRLKKDKKM